MKSSKQLTKRGFSPIFNKNTQASERKKKSSSNYHPLAYKHKEFEPYNKTDKKRASNYLREVTKNTQSISKVRIVTQPPDERHMAIISASFIPSKSRTKIHQEHSSHKVRQVSVPRTETQCPNCQKYSEQLGHLKQEIKRIISEKSLWKNGQINLEEVGAAWNIGSLKMKAKPINRSTDFMLEDIKKHFHDLMRDIQSLTQIDYPKMLALKIFKHTPIMDPYKNNDQIQVKQLLGQLRNHYEGKITTWDLEDETEESDHIKAILRNLKARLNHYLRQNLQTKAKVAVLQQAGQMTGQTQQYLRLIIEDVLKSYGSKI